MSRPTRNARQTALTSLQTNDTTHAEQQALLDAVDRVRTPTSASSTGRRSQHPPTYDPAVPNVWRHEEALYDPTAPAWADEVEPSIPAHRRAAARYSPSIPAYSPTSRSHRLTQTQQQQQYDPTSPLYTYSPTSAVASGEASPGSDAGQRRGLDDIISIYAQHFSPRLRSLHLLLEEFVESVDSRFDKVDRHLHLLVNSIRQLKGVEGGNPVASDKKRKRAGKRVSFDTAEEEAKNDDDDNNNNDDDDDDTDHDFPSHPPTKKARPFQPSTPPNQESPTSPQPPKAPAPQKPPPKRPASATPSPKTPPRKKPTPASNSPNVPQAPRKPAPNRPTASSSSSSSSSPSIKSSSRQPESAPATKPTRKSTRAPKPAPAPAQVSLSSPPTTRQTRQDTRLAAQAAVQPKEKERKEKQSTRICALRRPLY